MRRGHPGRWKHKSKRGSGPRLSSSLAEPVRVEREAREETSEGDRASSCGTQGISLSFLPTLYQPDSLPKENGPR